MTEKSSESNDEVFKGKQRKTFHNLDDKLKERIHAAQESKSAGKDLFIEGAKIAETASELLDDLLAKTQGTKSDEKATSEEIAKLMKDLEDEIEELEKKNFQLPKKRPRKWFSPY